MAASHRALLQMQLLASCSLARSQIDGLRFSNVTVAGHDADSAPAQYSQKLSTCCRPSPAEVIDRNGLCVDQYTSRGSSESTFDRVLTALPRPNNLRIHYATVAELAADATRDVCAVLRCERGYVNGGCRPAVGLRGTVVQRY
jgi:hypothetical protein